MRISTLPKYLIGNRSAILEVAGSRMALTIGILFTISAGFAREYDGEDLLHEPWYVLIPLAASLVMGSALFALIHRAVSLRRKDVEGTPPSQAKAFRSFIGLFLMTAPLAWLYAVPYEEFLSPFEAMRWNLCTLAVVAVWRVILISRVISVVYGMRLVHAFFLVMLFADVLTFLVVVLMPKPIVAIMGGIRYSEVDRLVLYVTHNLMVWSVLTVLVWLIGSVICLNLIKKAWPDQQSQQATHKHHSLFVFALVSIVAWTPALWISQPDQWRKREADELLRKGEVAKAFQLMSMHEPDQYPASWNPPPRNTYGEYVPEIDEIIEVMRDNWPTDWVAEIYLDKIRRATKQALRLYHNGEEWSDLTERMDKGWLDSVREENIGKLEFLQEYDQTLTEDDHEVITRLIEIAQTEAEEKQSEAPANGLSGTIKRSD